jgi:hypothetical protein
MQKQYKFFKKQDDYGEVKTIAMVMTVTNDNGEKVTLKAIHVVSDDQLDAVTSMSDAEILSLTETTMNASFSEQDISDAFTSPLTV